MPNHLDPARREVATEPTPGPWVAEEDEGYWGVIAESDGDAVAILWNPDRPLRINEAAANARLIAAGRDYHAACGGDLHPGEAEMCGPLAWLSTAIDTLCEPAVREAAVGDDPDAYAEMVQELYCLHRLLSAALAKARGEP